MFVDTVAISGTAAVSPTAPLLPVTGDLWFNTLTNGLATWDGIAWVLVTGTGPAAAAGNPIVSGAIVGKAIVLTLTDGTTVSIDTTTMNIVNLEGDFGATGTKGTIDEYTINMGRY
jgi:hypothetical protein